ncbi:hypothetical protein EYF80_038545 [Liparis tanakae]|uniref:Uncharacterized protein n=1 Tax=Liparis tanakae TaxID=230148 RepID=A0A4Z2GDL8_9TELE|nr:hypothetical protein EYF80_038545 [Liparis tanakae]
MLQVHKSRMWEEEEEEEGSNRAERERERFTPSDVLEVHGGHVPSAPRETEVGQLGVPVDDGLEEAGVERPVDVAGRRLELGVPRGLQLVRAGLQVPVGADGPQALWRHSQEEGVEHDQRLVSLGTSLQADGGPTAPIGGVVLVPVRLHLVGSHFTRVGAVRVPADGVLRRRRELDVLDDHGRPVAALQVQPDDLPVAAPQRLDLRSDAQGRRAARPQDEVLVLRFHFQSELRGEEEEEEEEDEEGVLSASSTN